MNKIDEEGRLHIDDDDARGGQTTGHVRWILGIGLGGAIIAMSAIWIFQALYG